MNDIYIKSSYEKLFDMSLDMLSIANTEGYFVEVNPSFHRVLGYSTEYLLSIPFLNLVHPDDVTKTLELFSNLKMGQTVFEFENRYKHIEGHYIDFSWTASVDTNKGLIYAVARDITERVKLKSRLKQIESALYEKAIIGITDAKGIIVDVNDNFCEISGYSKSELIGKTHKIINSGHHSSDFFDNMWATIAKGKVWSGTIKNITKKGTFYYVYSIITPVFDNENRITNYLAIRHDVTDSINNAHELSKTLKILSETSAIAKVGGWELNVKSGELTWTDETFAILEVDNKKDKCPILPEGLQLFVPEHQPIIENAVNRAIEYGEPYNLELKGLTAKGNIKWVSTNGKPNYENGEVVTISGTIQDIHLRKTTELLYDQERQKSIQSSKLASLGELAASVAHEINNPLGIISTYTEALINLPYQKEKTDKKLSVIQKSTERISHIVKSLKKFSSTDDVNTKVALKLSTIVTEAIILIAPKLKRENINIIYELNDRHLIYANEIEIEQVIINLMSNAIYAIKDLKEKWIEINTRDIDNAVELSVKDSGKGLPKDVQTKMFEPFYTSKSLGDGTGLGLSITKGILDDHNASIWLDLNSPNTCFVIKFLKFEE